LGSAGTPWDETVITPVDGWHPGRLRDLWEYRELLFFLVWRDVKVRYKQTALGATWAILQPTLAMIVFTVVFGHIAGVSSNGVPYPLFAYAGILPWTFVAQTVTQASGSLIASSNLISKVYFPRLAVPISCVVSGVVDVVIASLMLAVLMVYYQVGPSASAVWIPALVVIAFSTALGIGAWLAALNVEYRDVRYVVPFLVQIWLFLTPVIYPASTVTAKIEAAGLPGWIYGLNPMVGVVEGFRWALLGVAPPGLGTMVASAAAAAALLATGVGYFLRMEATFADVV